MAIYLCQLYAHYIPLCPTHIQLHELLTVVV